MSKLPYFWLKLKSERNNSFIPFLVETEYWYILKDITNTNFLNVHGRCCSALLATPFN